MTKKAKKTELTITVNAKWSKYWLVKSSGEKDTITMKWGNRPSGSPGEKETLIPLFECMVDHNLDLGPEVRWKGFDVIIPSLSLEQKPKQKIGLLASNLSISLLLGQRRQRIPPESIFSKTVLKANESITTYQLTENEFKKLQGYFYSKGKAVTEINPQVNEYFGELLKKILEGAGYVVIIEAPDYYYPSPTSVGYLAPAFGLSLTKTIEPTIEKGYETIYGFFSYDKPMMKTKIQRNFLDEIPEERLERIAGHLKENLSPYGLKCLSLVMRECGRNNRNPWFVMDTNKCLDAMGYERNMKGVHLPRNKQRLYRELEALAKIRFNVEARAKKKGAQKTEYVLKFDGALLHITHLEVHEVREGKSLTENTKIQDGVRVFIDPDIYSFVKKGWYAVFPDAFLKIDTGRRGHAIQIYHYINNQWRVGWHQHRGTFRQGLLAILDNSGALGNFHRKRRNQQRDYINQRLDDLTWLEEQKEFWIQDVKKDFQNRPQFDPIITVIIANAHPLRASMRKQIGKKGD